MFKLSNKQAKILMVAIPVLLLLGVILYFALRKKPSNGSGKPTGVGAQFVEGYQTEYASGRELALNVTFTTPSSAGYAGATLSGGALLYTVECPDNKCPPQVKNPSDNDIASNMSTYVQGVFTPNSGDSTKTNTAIDGRFILNADQFPSGSYFTFAIILKNSKGIYSDAVYLTSPIKVPDASPGPVTALDAKYL